MITKLFRNARMLWTVRREIFEAGSKMAETGQWGGMDKLKRDTVRLVERHARETGRADLQAIAALTRAEWMPADAPRRWCPICRRRGPHDCPANSSSIMEE